MSLNALNMISVHMEIPQPPNVKCVGKTLQDLVKLVVVEVHNNVSVVMLDSL